MVSADGVEEWSRKRSGGGRRRRRDGSNANVDFLDAVGSRVHVPISNYDFEPPGRGPAGRRR